jgi:hypothetical protein
MTWEVVANIFDNDQCGDCEYLIQTSDPDISFLSDVHCRVLEGECLPDCPSNCPKLEDELKYIEDLNNVS